MPYVPLSESIRFKKMVDFVIVDGVRNFVPHGAFRHIEPPKTIFARHIFALPDHLNATDTRILTGIFGKALRLAEIVFFIGAVRFQDVDNIPTIRVFPDDKHIGIGALPNAVHFVRYAQRPRGSGEIANPTDKILSLMTAMW